MFVTTVVLASVGCGPGLAVDDPEAAPDDVGDQGLDAESTGLVGPTWFSSSTRWSLRFRMLSTRERRGIMTFTADRGAERVTGEVTRAGNVMTFVGPADSRGLRLSTAWYYTQTANGQLVLQDGAQRSKPFLRTLAPESGSASYRPAVIPDSIGWVTGKWGPRPGLVGWTFCISSAGSNFGGFEATHPSGASVVGVVDFPFERGEATFSGLDRQLATWSVLGGKEQTGDELTFTGTLRGSPASTWTSTPVFDLRGSFVLLDPDESACR
jgi:hypothetical protein